MAVIGGKDIAGPTSPSPALSTQKLQTCFKTFILVSKSLQAHLENLQVSSLTTASFQSFWF